MTMRFVFLMIAALCATNVQAQSLNGVVVEVTDGDTATIITTDDDEVEIRFYGIDTPETKNPWLGWDAQPFSAEAKQFTKNMMEGKEVFVRLKGEITHGRPVGEIFVDGRSASRELAREGLAWWNKKYQKDDLDIARLVFSAKAANKGLWTDSNPVAPWIWRATKGQTTSATRGFAARIEALKEFLSLEFQDE